VLAFCLPWVFCLQSAIQGYELPDNCDEAPPFAQTHKPAPTVHIDHDEIRTSCWRKTAEAD
jgi:hypothetical protein